MPILNDQWDEGLISPLDIQLDELNPRVEPAHRSSPDAILQFLFNKEGIVPLAKAINESQGLFPHEKIIGLRTGTEVIVLEGNRRVAACKLLLKPTLLPHESMTKSLPECSEITRRQIEEIPIIYAATRQIADEVIANIHISTVRKNWSEIGQIRFASDRYHQKRSIEDIARDLHCDEIDVLRLIAQDNLYRFVTGLGWTAKEQEVIWDFNIQLKPFFDLVNSNKTSKYFGFDLIDSMGRIHPGIPEIYDIIRVMARHCILSQRIQQDRRFNAQSSIEQYLMSTFPEYNKSETILDEQQTEFHLHPNVTNTNPSNFVQPNYDADDIYENHEESHNNTVSNNYAIAQENTSQPEITSTRGEQNIHSVRFFEYLICSRTDDRHLMQLCRELKNISHDLNRYGISAACLLRTALEYCLKVHLLDIKKYKLVKDGREPKLSEMIEFCKNRKNRCFEDNHISRKIDVISARKVIDDLDLVIHGSMGNYDSNHLKRIAGDIRPVINFIMNKTDLK